MVERDSVTTVRTNRHVGSIVQLIETSNDRQRLARSRVAAHEEALRTKLPIRILREEIGIFACNLCPLQRVRDCREDYW